MDAYSAGVRLCSVSVTCAYVAYTNVTNTHMFRYPRLNVRVLVHVSHKHWV